jgi:phage tail protein I
MEELKMIDIFNCHITDILPRVLTKDYEVIALSDTLSVVLKRYFEIMKHCMIIADIDSLNENILDERAVELNIPYYDSNMNLTTKKTLVKQAISLYKKAGTISAVSDVVNYALGSGEVIEWFKFKGTPGTFKISTTADIDIKSINLLQNIISRVKNVSSTLILIERGNKTNGNIFVGLGVVMANKTVIGG